MEQDMNTTGISEIILLGFEFQQDFKYLIFFLFLVIYMVTTAGNVMIILLVSTSYRLQLPMYFFLGHLSFSDVLLISNIVPILLHVTLLGGGILSLTACITQFFLYGASTTTGCLLLTVMSYDRYLAICNPLHYSTIMDHKMCIYLVTFSWSLGFTVTLFTIFLMQTLWFCGPNVIDHFFCDLGPLLELSCSDVSLVNYVVFMFSSILTIIPFLFIMITYLFISLTILKITSATERQKTFSTCSSHLAVVCTCYGALFAMYLVPSGDQSTSVNKVISLMYTVVTPFVNPIIYSLRNQEIKSMQEVEEPTVEAPSTSVDTVAELKRLQAESDGITGVVAVLVDVVARLDDDEDAGTDSLCVVDGVDGVLDELYICLIMAAAIGS
ncbi:olfactory receptor 5J3-like [Hyperolius riggenbachi]|uniref:olfactory receptor 5J3-like n=1 Tax=Hyperolius riggenbachi TaxID=752182 RepID=UPI0035A3BE7D